MSEKAKKQDRRTRYTRQTIKDTFLELLKQKSFTKITVTEVCKNAEINRGTFYCIFRKNCASVPEERSAIPLQTEQSSVG